ncbi:hypothetical protein [Microbacterium aurugineum]|uniref:DUF5134 domain-containing protein n=1 Tax=Microbacterium aurugineum TaxID=2851642 RepID=A0ABY4J3G5_9MICO|nr:hypothetical protein [Microbacterium aurugineum]UPL18343.1 hypothetical protein KV397_11555 [Microbacterium aurugineum]
MELLLPAAPWLMAVAAIVAAVACIGAWRAVPWQGRQAALIMAAAMLALAVSPGDALAGLLLGVLLLVSAMLGTMGVRGTSAASACCHRALGSLVMAVCAFQSASTRAVQSAGAGAEIAVSGHGGHGMNGVLSVVMLVGVAGVVVWTVVSEWFLPSVHRGRTARLLATESWAMAAGVVIMCVGF